MKVRVRWDMPIGHTHNVKEKIVEVEKYEETGSVYLHFFANDEVRVVVSPVSPQVSFTTTSNLKLSNRRYFCIFLLVEADSCKR